MVRHLRTASLIALATALLMGSASAETIKIGVNVPADVRTYRPM